MDAFLATIFAFPTLVFTVGLMLSLFYWLFVMVGALDLDIADGDLDLGDAGDAGDAGDGAEAGDVDAGDGPLAAIFSAFSLRKAPLTVSLSLLFFFGWMISYYASVYLSPVVPGPEIIANLTVLFATLFVATPLASVASRPLGKLFVANKAPSKRALVGQVARVRVHADVGEKGQASLASSRGSLLRVRSSDAALEKNAKVLLIDYDEKTDTFEVEAMDSVLGKSESAS